MFKKISRTFPIVILLFLTITAIFFQYNQIPRNINYDEIDFAKLALSLSNKSYIPYTPFATGHATLYFYLILFSFKLFGINNFALRFPSAVFGVLNVLILYLIFCRAFSKHRYFSVFICLITLTLHWYLNFTRFSFEATFLLFLELLSIYYFFQFTDKSNWKHLFLSGFFAGLAFNSYPPGRIFFLLPLIFLIFKKIKIIVFLIPFILMITPLLIYFVQNSDIRVKQQFYLSSKKISFKNKVSYLFENSKKMILMFYFFGDMNGRHNYPGKPSLNPILGILLIIGLLIGLKKIHLFYNQFFLLYFLISVIPTLLTNPSENPNMLRTFTLIPSTVYFIGVAINKIINKNKSSIISLCIIFLLFISTIYELRTYFIFQSGVARNSFEFKCPIEKLVYENPPYPKECRVSRNEF